MNMGTTRGTADVIGAIPYRLALAGGWIDQPFVSRLNPAVPGAMVVVSIEPTCWFMQRAGIATGTRHVAAQLWHGHLPDRPPADRWSRNCTKRRIAANASLPVRKT